jgi:hypothetical protein
MSLQGVVEIGEDSQLALRTLDYLRRYPQAKDSVEGIARFWVNTDLIEVRRSLDKLVDLKLVVKRVNAFIDFYSMEVEKAS